MDKPIRRVGFVGLGIMGAPMAGNVLKAGFGLTVWNRTSEKCAPLVALGASVADSPAALAASGPDVILINVTDTPDAEAVLLGDDGVLAGASPGLVVVDHSTISPEATQAFSKKLGERGVTLIDAPVSGGDVGARAGTLSVMVGGPEDAVTRVWPLFEAVGQAITHVGPVGMGQACKACNQVAVVNSLVGACEALKLAGSLGLDAQKMIDVVSAGAGGSWQLAHLGPRIAAGDFAPGFTIDLVLKDLGIVRDAAGHAGLPLGGTEHASGLFAQARARGDGALGTQAIGKPAP